MDNITNPTKGKSDDKGEASAKVPVDKAKSVTKFVKISSFVLLAICVVVFSLLIPSPDIFLGSRSLLCASIVGSVVGIIITLVNDDTHSINMKDAGATELIYVSIKLTLGIVISFITLSMLVVFLPKEHASNANLQIAIALLSGILSDIPKIIGLIKP